MNIALGKSTLCHFTSDPLALIGRSPLNHPTCTTLVSRLKHHSEENTAGSLLQLHKGFTAEISRYLVSPTSGSDQF